MLNEVVIDRGMKPQLCNLQVCTFSCCTTGLLGGSTADNGAGNMQACPPARHHHNQLLQALGTIFRFRTLTVLKCECARSACPQCYVDQAYVTVVQGDGLIVATPTGAMDSQMSQACEAAALQAEQPVVVQASVPGGWGWGVQ